MRMLLNWVLSALAVWIMSRVVPGIYVNGAIAALIAALAIGFINANAGTVVEDFDISAHCGHAGIVLAGDQCADAGVCLRPGTGISGAGIFRGVCGRDRVEPGEYAFEMAGVPGGRAAPIVFQSSLRSTISN
jgi:hypothetical protein